MNRKRNAHQIAPLSEFEPLLSQLRQALDCNNNEAMEHIGYAGASHLSEWRRTGQAATLGINAAKGVLAELGHTPVIPKATSPFTIEEMSQLFALCIGVALPKEQLAPLMRKLAREMQETP